MSKKLWFAPVFALALAAVPSVARADAWFECQAIGVYENNNRVSVLCSNTLIANGDDVVYFAISNSDAAKAARFVSMAATAVASGQIFSVYAPTLSTTNISGCQASNCRTPTSWGLKNEN
jgi:hypothetical protein